MSAPDPRPPEAGGRPAEGSAGPDTPQPEIALAGFSERVLAFCIDLLPFWAAYYAGLYTLKTAPLRWSLLCTSSFLIYQAYLSCEGRRSFGKRLVGLRVVNLEQEPLSLGPAILRSATYLPSSVLGLGFLWSLASRSRQCWHDMVAASLVIRERSKSPLSQLGTHLAASICLFLIAFSWYWRVYAGPRYQRFMDLAYAEVGLQELDELQKAYHRKHGRYAGSHQELSPLSLDPRRFLEDMAALFDAETGIKIKASREGYIIAARARDRRRTPMTHRGP